MRVAILYISVLVIYFCYMLWKEYKIEKERTAFVKKYELKNKYIKKFAKTQYKSEHPNTEINKVIDGILYLYENKIIYLDRWRKNILFKIPYKEIIKIKINKKECPKKLIKLHILFNYEQKEHEIYFLNTKKMINTIYKELNKKKESTK